MTDNEIIKALELCIDDECRCGECPYFGIASDDVSCGKEHGIDMLDLINRQKEEIERLNGDLIVERTRRKNAVDAYHEAKAQAIKEFADKVTDLIHEADDINLFRSGKFTTL